MTDPHIPDNTPVWSVPADMEKMQARIAELEAERDGVPVCTEHAQELLDRDCCVICEIDRLKGKLAECKAALKPFGDNPVGDFDDMPDDTQVFIDTTDNNKCAWALANNLTIGHFRRAAELTAGPVKLKGEGHPITPDGMDKLRRVVEASEKQAKIDSRVDHEVMQKAYDKDGE